MKMSVDQNLAMAQHLRRSAHALAQDDQKRRTILDRARSFLMLAKQARDEDWPSSVSAPFVILTSEESESAWSDPPTRQRVFVPYLTATELEALQRSANETSEYARKAFAHLGPKE
jgi:hypothetical protein